MNILKFILSRIFLMMILIAVPLFAQITALDPEKTVNLVTGQMGFSLNLGTLKGINGHDFPINLNYKSGIKK